MYFASKKDLKYAFFFWSPVLLIILFFILDLSQNLPAYILSFSYIALSLWQWYGTGYKVGGGSIKIMSGPFRRRVKIMDIKKLTKSKFGYAVGTAQSKDKLEILYGKENDVINVSPKDKSGFIKTLLNENPHILVDQPSSYE